MNASQSMLFATFHKSEQLSKQLHSKIIDRLIVRNLIDLSMRYWKGEEINKNEWQTIVKNSYLPLTIYEELFSGVLSLTLAVLRIPEKSFSPEMVCDELIKLGFTLDQAEQIVKLKTISTPNVPTFLKLNGDVKWRIDVTISTSDVSRILEPWILMEFNLGSGLKTIHIPLTQFHSLRYQVASCLNQLSKLSPPEH